MLQIHGNYYTDPKIKYIKSSKRNNAGQAQLNFGILTKDVKISKRDFVAVTFLSSGTLAWFFLFFTNFENIFTQNLTVDFFWAYVGKAVFLTFAALSAIIGSMTSRRISLRKLMASWVALGIFATASLAIFQGLFFSLLISGLLGISFGLGYPICFGFLADCTNVEERGRVAGAVFVEGFILVFLAYVVSAIFNFGTTETILLSVVLRSISLPALAIVSPRKEQVRESSWRSVFGNKNFILYLVPWIMFNIASGLYTFVWYWIHQLPNFAEYIWAIDTGNVLHALMPAVFAFIAGIAADRLGRKQPVIFGMIMLGVSFGFLGLFTSPDSVLFYMTISGVAWGFLMAVYATVAGDVAHGESKEKFYALSTILPLIINMSLNGVADFFGVGIDARTLSSVLSIILFASVIPVLRAAETLPETKIKERKLSEHLKKVGELVEETRKAE